jgi:hypothetical protein
MTDPSSTGGGREARAKKRGRAPPGLQIQVDGVMWAFFATDILYMYIYLLCVYIDLYNLQLRISAWFSDQCCCRSLSLYLRMPSPGGKPASSQDVLRNYSATALTKRRRPRTDAQLWRQKIARKKQHSSL